MVSDTPPRRRSPVDQAITTLFIGALVLTVAVGSFMFGRSRIDGPKVINAPGSSAPIAVDLSSSTTVAARRDFASSSSDTSSSTESTVNSNSSASDAPIYSVPRSVPTTGPTTTAPATTQATEPATTTPATSP